MEITAKEARAKWSDLLKRERRFCCSGEEKR